MNYFGHNAKLSKIHLNDNTQENDLNRKGIKITIR